MRTRSSRLVGTCIIGLIASIALAAIAFARSRAAGGFYDAQVYAMTPQIHRRYAWIALAFAAAFAACLLPAAESLRFWVAAAFALVALFYLTSYLRGAHEEED